MMALGTVQCSERMRPSFRTTQDVEHPQTKVVNRATVMVSATMTSLPKSLARACSSRGVGGEGAGE